MTPLTVTEARAILIADNLLSDAIGPVNRQLVLRQRFGDDETLAAWEHLVNSAIDRVKGFVR